MLTSLKVVRMALVDCDCSRRSATRARRRLIGTRCSGRSPRFGAPAARRPAAAPAWRARRGAAARRSAAWRRRRPRRRARRPWSRGRPCRCRPPMPAARLLSAISLAAAGMATSALRAAGGGAAARRRAAAGAAAAGAAPPRARRCGAGLAFGVDLARSPVRLATVAPSRRRARPARRPPAPALRARPCRSRSRSGFRRWRRLRRASSSSCSMVASATDSDSCGTLTSTIAMLFLS